MALFYSPKLGFDGEKAGGSPTGTLDETVTRLLNYSVEALSSSRRVDRVASVLDMFWLSPIKAEGQF